MLTLSLSGLRRGPHSALLDTGGYGPGSGFACGRLSLGEPVGTDMVLVLLVAGFFLLADLLLLVVLLFAAQSNLAFLGMWRCSTRPDLAELLPFDADAGSSSNMASSPPGRPNRVQSWSGGRLGANFYGVREKRGGRVVDLRI